MSIKEFVSEAVQGMQIGDRRAVVLVDGITLSSFRSTLYKYSVDNNRRYSTKYYARARTVSVYLEKVDGNQDELP
jgi:hypothetical protein